MFEDVIQSGKCAVCGAYHEFPKMITCTIRDNREFHICKGCFKMFEKAPVSPLYFPAFMKIKENLKLDFFPAHFEYKI